MSVHAKRSHRQRAIEFLACEWQVPIHQVTQLYESEWAELAVDARIAGFLPIFAFRNVRKTLRHRARSMSATAQPASLLSVASEVPIHVDAVEMGDAGRQRASLSF